MSWFKGKNVKVNLGGPESRFGRLMDVKKDYLSIHSDKDGVIYYQLEHIKALSIDSRDHSKRSKRVKCYEDEHFHDVLKRFKHKKIKLNREGPESVEGVLNNIFDHYIEVNVRDEVLFVSIFHIKSISQVSKKKRSSGRKKSSGKHHSGGKKSSGKHHSGGKKSSGKKSSGKHSSGRKKSSGKHSSGHRKHSGCPHCGRKGSSSGWGHCGCQKSSGRHSGHRKSSAKKVSKAVSKARRTGTHKYFFNDPYETSGSGKSKSSRGSSGKHSKDFKHSNKSKRDHKHHWNPKKQVLKGGWVKLN